MKMFINIAVTLLCLPWGPMIMMSPMMIAAEDFANSKSAIIQAIVFFLYPAFIFLLLKLTGLKFYGTNPIWWALATFATGILVTIAYGLPQKLYNASRGISNYDYFIYQDEVYFNGDRIKGADAKTFTHYNAFSYYSKDKNHVYYENKKLSDADAPTFGPLLNDEAQNYWRDKHHAYYKWNKIPSADGATFTYLGHQYACDKKQVYYEGQVVKDADRNTFQAMEGYLGKDAFHVFVRDVHVLNVKDPATFETVKLNEEWFGKDKAQLYVIRYAPPHPLLPFPDADLKTFEVVGDYYAKDKNRVYYYSYHIDQILVLEGAHPETFRLQYDNEKNTDATDGERYYTSGQLYAQ
ncbi:MAG: rane protein [Cytophagaceae bacterium]|jgi:hypothetical protein|nr:rane protein [Cytophagaceae bacterium]